MFIKFHPMSLEGEIGSIHPQGADYQILGVSFLRERERETPRKLPRAWWENRMGMDDMCALFFREGGVYQ